MTGTIYKINGIGEDGEKLFEIFRYGFDTACAKARTIKANNDEIVKVIVTKIVSKVVYEV